MTNTSRSMDKLYRRLYIQSKSYDEVFELVKKKAELLASIPAIQPVTKSGIARLASGFGYRIHPIYKTHMMHEGIDFTLSEQKFIRQGMALWRKWNITAEAMGIISSSIMVMGIPPCMDI